MQPDIVLTKRHFDEGLSAEDFTAFAGYMVSTYRLSEFPYWKELKSNSPLTDEQQEARTNAILKAVQKTIPSCTEERLGYIPKRTTPGLYYDLERFDDIPTVQQLRFHFGCLMRGDVASTVFTHPANGRNSRHVVMPGVLNEDIDVTGLFRGCIAVVFQNDPDETITSHFALKLGMREDRVAIKNLRGCRGQLVEGDLHEADHLRALCPYTRSNAPRYYEELSADLFARHILGRTRRCQKTIEASLHRRYVGLLRTSFDGWFAPAMEDIVRRKIPPDFFAVCHTMDEIKARLALEAKGEPHQWKDSRTIIMNQCDGWLIKQFFHEPEVPLSLLKNIVDANVFTEPLVRRTAQRIVEAAEFFNPDLTHEHRPETKVKFPYWMQRTTSVPEAKIA